MGKKANNERARPKTPRFGEIMRNGDLAAAWVRDHPEQARELALALAGLCMLYPRLEQGAEIAERLSWQNPALHAALADMPGPVVLAIADAARSASSATAAAKKPAPAWHTVAKREAERLIAQGTAPRNVASKIARMPEFKDHGVKAIRSALKKSAL